MSHKLNNIFLVLTIYVFSIQISVLADTETVGSYSGSPIEANFVQDNYDHQNESRTINQTSLTWMRKFGELLDESFSISIQETRDNGYIVLGTKPNDIALIKVNRTGDLEWEKNLVATFGNSVHQTSDNGYIITGCKKMGESDNEDASDCWLAKTDSNGNILWDKTYTNSIRGQFVEETKDGGYIIIGKCNSSNFGSVWLHKTDSSGNKIWEERFDSKFMDYGVSVHQTKEGGYIIAGNAGGYLWVIKTDSVGKTKWERNFESISPWDGDPIQETSDGGYIVVGSTYPLESGFDVCLIKLDVRGQKVWEKTFGDRYHDWGYTVKETKDGGYIITGSKDRTKVENGEWYEGGDVWLIKTDPYGNKEWDRTFGGMGTDIGSDVEQTQDDGFILSAFTKPSSEAYGQLLLIKTNPKGEVIPSPIEDMNSNPNKENTSTYSSVSIKENSIPIIHSILSDLSSPQIAGNTITWTVNASDIENDTLLYKFYLKGPNTGNKWKEETGWISENIWTWTTSENDIGYNLVRVYIRDRKHAGPDSFDGDRAVSFNITMPEIDSEVTSQYSANSEGWVATFNRSTIRDVGYSVQQTTDGGYIIVGDTQISSTQYAILIIKTDANGKIQWDKAFFELHGCHGYSIRQTLDGGYIIVGCIEKTEGMSYRFDAWLIKIDSQGGKQWDRALGGGMDDIGYTIQQTSDGGYILAGLTQSYHIKGIYDPIVKGTYYPGAYGTWNMDNEAWLVKTDSQGIEQWNRTFGEQRDTFSDSYIYDTNAHSVQQTTDGGYIIVGEKHGKGIWLIKTDHLGNEQWNRTFGGSEDSGWFVQQTSDGGYIVISNKISYSLDPNVFGGLWFIKTDAEGNLLWDKILNSDGSFDFCSGQQTSDGGYIIIAGSSLIKTDSHGNEQWNKTFGRPKLYLGHSVQQTSDGGYIVAGGTESFNSESDYLWLIKTGPNGNLN